MKKITKAKLAVAGALAIVIGVNVFAASAVTAPTTRTASPGAGYHWGIAWNTTNFPNKTVDQPLTYTGLGFSYGGYTTLREALMIGRNNTSAVVTPVLTRVTEPFRLNTDFLSITFVGTGYLDPRAGAVSATPAFGATDQSGAGNTGAVWCSTTEWATTASFIKRTALGNYSSSGWGNGSTTTVTLLGTSGYNWAANCPYIQAFQTNLCYYATLTATTWTCLLVKWTAESLFDHHAYSNRNIAADLCATTAGAAVSVDCAYVSGVSDPTDFNQLCVKNAPTAAWLDFSWFGAVFSFYGECLFNPRGGWDRNHVVADAWAAGHAGDLAVKVEDSTEHLHVIESCGPMWSAPSVDGLESFIVDTCTWTWATPVKHFMQLVFAAMSGSWILFFVFTAIAGVVNRNMPTPFSEINAGGGA